MKLKDIKLRVPNHNMGLDVSLDVSLDTKVMMSSFLPAIRSKSELASTTISPKSMQKSGLSLVKK